MGRRLESLHAVSLLTAASKLKSSRPAKAACAETWRVALASCLEAGGERPLWKVGECQGCEAEVVSQGPHQLKVWLHSGVHRHAARTVLGASATWLWSPIREILIHWDAGYAQRLATEHLSHHRRRPKKSGSVGRGLPPPLARGSSRVDLPVLYSLKGCHCLEPEKGANKKKKICGSPLNLCRTGCSAKRV